MTRPRAAASALLLFALLAPSASPLRAQQPATPAATPAQTQPQTQAQTPPQPAPAADPVERIKEEGLKRSEVMRTLSHLTEVIGPRLTGSPAMRRANEWTRERLAQWGLANAHLEPWGPFGRGWTLKRFSAEAIEPQAFPLLAYPRAWSPGLDAPLTADVVVVEAKTEEELQKYKGQLRGKIVLTGTERASTPRFEPSATRLTEKQLLELADAPDPAILPRRPPRPPLSAEQIAALRFADRRTQFYYEEGVALLVGSSPGGDGGMLQFVQSAAVPQASDAPAEQRKSPWQKDAPKLIPQIALANDHYNRLARMLRQGEKVRLNVNLQVEFDDSDPMSYNTIAEIPGADLKDEVVMLGAHLDSWHTATGATDNAAGVAIMMEAVRIIKALGLQPRRTIRIALWSGEEQGLLGSRFYVREHFGPLPAPTPAAAGATAQPATAAPAQARFKPEHESLNVYYNADSGAGAVRGVYLQGNEALRPIFRRWLLPFSQFKVGANVYTATTVTAANSSGSDFLAFDAVGLNGIDFLQDELEYGTRTWHSNQDTYDRVVPEDLIQAATVVAAFVYNSAMMDTPLPRKPYRAPSGRR